MKNGAQTSNNLFVIIKLDDQVFGLPVAFTREMVVMPQVTNVPRVPSEVRGVINLRGRVLPVVDLRAKLGLRSCLSEREEVLGMMEARKADHLAWLDELKSAVDEGRDFKLATDPHRCAFGQWYDSYDPDADNCTRLVDMIRRFKHPHNKVHAIAKKAMAWAKAGQIERAHEVIEKTRTTDLREMVELFEQTRRVIMEDTREIAVVMGQGGSSIALAVDSVASVERLALHEEDEETIREINADSGLVTGLGRRGKQEQTVMLLDPEALLSAASSI